MSQQTGLGSGQIHSSMHLGVLGVDGRDAGLVPARWLRSSLQALPPIHGRWLCGTWIRFRSRRKLDKLEETFSETGRYNPKRLIFNSSA
jgi:hypothetical protein